MNSSDMRAEASQIDDPANPATEGSDTTRLSVPIAPILSAAADDGEPTAVWSTMPGFCGCSSSFFMSQPVRPASAATITAAVATLWALCVLFIMYASSGGLVLEIQAEREVRRQARRLEFVLRFRLRQTVVRFRIDA